MERYAALAACLVFILIVFWRDRKLRPVPSWGTWVVFIWVVVIGSKSAGYWFGAEANMDSLDNYIEGSPLDRNIYLSLICLGAFALYRRSINWWKVISANPWLALFFCYCGVSIVWSDFPFVSFKRLVKDLGNLIMILVLFTEADPVGAFRAVLSRYVCCAVPLSVLLILYFPEYGLSYNPQTGDILYVAITTDKNELGVVLAVSGLFLVWEFVELMLHEFRKGKFADLLVRGTLLILIGYLIVIARSATALLCLAGGSTILILMRFAGFRSQIRHLGLYSLLGGCTLATLFVFTDFTDMLVKSVDKDITFTGRTDIWAGLLSEQVDPLIGTGYSSFWLKPSMMGQFHNIIQAHNGYLDTYLNGGLIGLALLLCVIAATAGKVRRQVLDGSNFALLLFSAFVISLFYNLSETMFNRLNLVWFMFLLAAVDFSCDYRTSEELPTSAGWSLAARRAAGTLPCKSTSPRPIRE
ncbi:O-antigen ligase family protein [Geomonas sp. Red32]|uniref:O-antigen ligase family protein n=1 Tax=Geomonas sp. Red32 TaxID=2912856 RepID=UPI00202CB148|nr:O-antigen ligase family protein [Geomonas sp. Red32]MCM0082857.1 O-antigen ligase family protein [Geomonas sp. Red32]